MSILMFNIIRKRRILSSGVILDHIIDSEKNIEKRLMRLMLQLYTTIHNRMEAFHTIKRSKNQPLLVNTGKECLGPIV
jgi:hypothetical protein